MTKENHSLSFKQLFVFWYPLAATWLMMAGENPFLTAVIARLPGPKFNLAAFGVAFSFALIAEAPIIMLMSASTALVTNSDAYFKLRRFTYLLNAAITLILLIGLIPPIFYFIAEGLIELPPNVARLTHVALILLIPWPAAIGFRRFYQGILIRFNLTRRVAYGTIIRLTTMAGAAIVLFHLKFPGAYVGAGALSIGVTCESIASRLMANNSIKHLLQQDNTHFKEKPLSFRFIAKFYYPLALMSTLSLGVHPFVTFFVGRSRYSIESLAVLPVINALVFIFRSLGLSYLEVVVALLGKKNEKYLPLRNFAWILGTAVVGTLSLIAFTPLAKTWFCHVAGLSEELVNFSYLPTRIATILPGLTVLISLQRGILVNTKHTSPITWATMIEVGVIIGVLFISITYLDVIGVIAASWAFTLGRFAANLYLFPHQLKAVRG
ncbi:MAG: hypothetical protein JSV88_23890 [Candidatus Aminicenantes bacterium]|nr:MAG: hypothetical protein JSV88_23890 [Candidatus Aminicenantes bacterium]